MANQLLDGDFTDDMDPEPIPPQEPKELRDYFAGQALAGALANPDPNMHTATMPANDFADMAYEVADAMLVRRKTERKQVKLWPIELEPDKDVSVG